MNVVLPKIRKRLVTLHDEQMFHYSTRQRIVEETFIAMNGSDFATGSIEEIVAISFLSPLTIASLKLIPLRKLGAVGQFEN